MTIIVLDKKTPSKSADVFRESFEKGKRKHLLRMQEQWWDYNGAAYVLIEDDTIHSEIKKFLDSAKRHESKKVYNQAAEEFERKLVAVPFDPSTANVNAVYEMLADEGHKAKAMLHAPTWIKKPEGEWAGLEARNLISLQNGLLDITTRKLYRATPNFFTFTGLPLAYDATAISPQWLAFLDQVAVRRPALVALLQEIFGHMLSGNLKRQKVFFLMGDPGSGKGTILRILSALIGSPQNVASASIRNLSTNFGMQGLIGKSMLQITDLDIEGGKQAMSATATAINAISGEDSVQIDRKHKDPWEGTLPTRIIMAGNGLPDFGVHTNALRRRLLAVPFDVSFDDHPDEDLTDKLKTELAGILNWGLDGLERLIDFGVFTEPEVSKEIKRRLLRQSSPLHGFTEEWCELGQGATDKVVLYHAYEEYCAVNRIAYVMPATKFGEEMLRLYKIKASKRRPFPGAPDKDRIPCYVGIRLNAAMAAKVYKVDGTLINLGLTGSEALERDANGYPIPRDEADRAHSDFA